MKSRGKNVGRGDSSRMYILPGSAFQQ